MIAFRRLLLGAVAGSCAGLAAADPWIAPGDAGLRSDIELLADAGIVRGPVTTWPLSLPDVARDVGATDGRGLDAATAEALLRVQRRSRAAANMGYSGLGTRVAAAYEPVQFRSFAETPREEGEIGAQASWMTDHLVVKLKGTFVADPDDGKRFRADGSYLGVNVGNFILSAGLLERWWGPGWEGSMILSTNARPIPGITLERNYTDPFRTRLLSWLGPWRASIALGEAEGSGVAVSNVRFLAARVNARPRPWLEFGLSRTAQWCGGDRECGWGTFTDMLFGRDNQTEGGSTVDQPGNQMAGYDLRVRSPWKSLPVAVYSQWIGEDEAGGLPSKFIGQLGMETWASLPIGGLRVRAEYSDTACNFTRGTPEYDCAYRNAIYPQGYAYRGRNLGHSIDRDGRMTSVAAMLAMNGGEHVSATVRRIELNRAGGEHPLIGVPASVEDVELRYSRPFGNGRIDAAVGYQGGHESSGLESGVRGYLIWQQGF